MSSSFSVDNKQSLYLLSITRTACDVWVMNKLRGSLNTQAALMWQFSMAETKYLCEITPLVAFNTHAYKKSATNLLDQRTTVVLHAV
jgi:hypothetical protein